jgi:histidine ammonia-lyase
VRGGHARPPPRRGASAIADLAGAMTLEGLLGSHRPFIVPHPARATSSRGRWPSPSTSARSSATRRSWRATPTARRSRTPTRCAACPRCTARRATAWPTRGGVLAIEVNSATDNPLVFPGEDLIVSGGNFHGQPVSLALDVLAIACTQLAAISERRVEQLVNPALSGLPPFLDRNSGLNSGFMIAQVTSAALVAESRMPQPPGLGGLHSLLRRARGPREHGHDRCAQGRAGGGVHPYLPRRGGAGRRAGARLPEAAPRRPGRRRGSRRRPTGRSPRWRRTGDHRDIEAVSDLIDSGALLAPRTPHDRTSRAGSAGRAPHGSLRD